MTRIQELITHVKKVQETADLDEVAQLLQTNEWIVLGLTRGDQDRFIMGYIPAQQAMKKPTALAILKSGCTIADADEIEAVWTAVKKQRYSLLSVTEVYVTHDADEVFEKLRSGEWIVEDAITESQFPEFVKKGKHFPNGPNFFILGRVRGIPSYRRERESASSIKDKTE